MKKEFESYGDYFQENKNIQKQRLVDMMRGDEELGLYKEEPKQEILEDFINKTIEESFEIELAASKINKYMNIAAKWQAARMYSEEEAFNLCRDFAIFAQQKRPSYKKQLEWFEQFKKK